MRENFLLPGISSAWPIRCQRRCFGISTLLLQLVRTRSRDWGLPPPLWSRDIRSRPRLVAKAEERSRSNQGRAGRRIGR